MFELIVMLMAVLRVRRRRGVSAGCGEAQTVLMVPALTLGSVCGGGTHAMILESVRAWCASNQKNGKIGYYRDGEWWAVQSHRQWVQAGAFSWLSENQFRSRVAALVERGLIVKSRWREGGANGYRVDEAALSAALVALESPGVVDFQRTPVEKSRTPSEIPQGVRGKSAEKSPINQSKNQSNESGHQSAYPPATPIDDDSTQKDSSNAKSDKSDPAAGLVRRYGSARVAEALEKARAFGAKNPYAYAARILRNEDDQASLRPTAFRRVSGEHFTGGRYAAFIDS